MAQKRSIFVSGCCRLVLVEKIILEVEVIIRVEKDTLVAGIFVGDFLVKDT